MSGATSSHTGSFYSGEMHFQITDLQRDCGPLADTHLVIVRQEHFDEAAVATDQSVAGRIHTRLFLRKDPDSVEASEAFAQQVRENFTKSTVKNLNDLHFVTDVDPASKADEPDAIIIQVELTQIDAGNKTKRVMIGLGRGASEVAAKVILISRRNGKEVPLQEILLDSQSGTKLGALTSPIGGVSVRALPREMLGTAKSTAQADAARLAKDLARYLNKLTTASSGAPPTETPSNLEQPQAR